MTESTVCLGDLAAVIRSKNAGPFVLTLDVFFRDKDVFQRVRDAGVTTKASVAKLYRVSENHVLEVTFFEAADALKVSIRRWVSSAAPGDTDAFGAQQHVPLMSLKLKLQGCRYSSFSEDEGRTQA